MSNTSDIESMPIREVIQRITNLSRELNKFWINAKGWAPIEAAELLSNSRLDWQVSLSEYLIHFIKMSPGSAASGELIMAWANLGSLVEGTLKLFLSVYYKDYRRSFSAIKRKGIVKDPDVLMLDQLRIFFTKEIWTDDEEWNDWIQHIQHRRNTIHSFANRDLGTHEEFLNDIRKYLCFLRYVNDRLPYTDNYYEPREL